MDMTPECVWPAGALLGEGPVWHDDERRFYWVDVEAGLVHSWDPASGSRGTWPVGETIGGLAVRRRGGFVAALRGGFAFLTLEPFAIERIAQPEPDLPDNRFNDAKCDAAGRFWAGTMNARLTAATGWLYRLDPDLRWSRHDGPYVCTNGPAFSPDGRTLYHTDTVGRTIWAFDLAADGEPTYKREFARFAAGEGQPDGMTVDAGGDLWVAHWGGGRITRFEPDGRRRATIRLPVAQVTSIAFAGAGSRLVCVTTALTGLDAAQRAAQPYAGGLFAFEVDAEGLAAGTFAG